ncbi:MAG: Na/Pi symporter, partial [Planctomycetaceae bacterium]|nr:Na/Pi symporter [Planctomycetaceae bacterium]
MDHSRPSTALFLPLLFVLCVFLPGCGDDGDVQPAGMAPQSSAIYTAPLAQSLDQSLRVHVFGQGADGPDKDIPVGGARVAFSIAEQPDDASGAVFSQSETVTNAAGLADVVFTVGDKPGIYRIQADLPDYPAIQPVSFTVLGGVSVTGGGQDGWVGKPLDQPLTLRMEKAPGVFLGPDEGLVRFTLMGAPSGTELSANVRRTDDLGRASAEVKVGKGQGRVDVGITILEGLPGETSRLAPIMVHFFSIDAFSVVVSMLGGLALFLFGMKMMSESLQFVAGDKLRDLLNLLTTNRFMAVAAGAMVTAIIQSSSACSVMVVGFVNAGLMKLTQAIGVIMGANIGTTIT